MKTGKTILILSILFTCLCCNKKANSIGQCTEKPSDGRMCTAIYQPVCGCNNKTYGNSCEAEARGIMKYTEGECAKTTPSR